MPDLEGGNSIAGHPFGRKAMERVRLAHDRAATNISKNPKPSKRRFRYGGATELPPHEFHALEVMNAFHGLLTSYQRAEQAIVFLQSFPTAKAYERKGIDRDDWMQYHFGSFAIAVSGLSDQCLALTNRVFRLGLPPRQCVGDTVLKNDWVRDTEIPATVRKVVDSVKEYREFRNRHVHQGARPDITELIDDDWYDHLTLLSLAERVEQGQTPRAFLTHGFRRASRQLVAKLENDRRVVQDLLLSFLSALLPYFDSYYENARPLADRVREIEARHEGGN